MIVAVGSSLVPNPWNLPVDVVFGVLTAIVIILLMLRRRRR